jgi:predicted anti-sigma-YlaC factor YlaD
MPCAEWEKLLLEYPELGPEARLPVEAHARVCPECRAFLETALELDAALRERFAGLAAPSSLAPAVLARISRQTPYRTLSPLPELLDFIGWAAVVAVAVVLWSLGWTR